jgi:hypothetical protein
MTTETTPLAATKPAEGPRRSWRRWLLIPAALVLLTAGAFAGASINSHHSQLVANQATISRLHHDLAVAQGQKAAALAQMKVAQQTAANAQQTAANATATANAKAKADYASRVAAVNALQQKLQQEQGIVQSSTISQDGVYVVGKDIPSGVYHTTGGNQCYYATLGSTDTSNILDNNNFNGPDTVDVSGAYAFEIQGGCTWVKAG